MQQSKYDRIESSPVHALPEVLDDNTLRGYQVKPTDLRKQRAELGVAPSAKHDKIQEITAQILELEKALERERANPRKHVLN